VCVYVSVSVCVKQRECEKECVYVVNVANHGKCGVCGKQHTHTLSLSLIESTRTKYGVATISRLLKIIGLFCRIVSFIGLFCKRDL